MSEEMLDEIPEDAEGFFMVWRGPRLRYLYGKKPQALQLLMLIMDRARYSEGWNPYGLKKFQCVLGRDDVFGATHLSEKQFRSAKRVLEEAGVCTFKGTNQGTIATLCNTVFCRNAGNEKGEQMGEQVDKEGAKVGRARGERGATNKEGNKENKGNNVREGGSLAWVKPSIHGGLKEQTAAVLQVFPHMNEMSVAGAIRTCPDDLRAKALGDMLEEVANMAEPPEHPLRMLKAFMRNAESFEKREQVKSVTAGPMSPEMLGGDL